MAHIHLIRHGQASFGGDDYDQLSAIGQRQAEVTGRHLKQLGLSFAGVYSGDMLRQADTADIAARAHGAMPARQTEGAFNEYDANGLFKCYLPATLKADAELAAMLQADRTLLFRDRRTFQRAFEQMIACWLRGDTSEHGQMEPWTDFVARVEAGLMHLHERHGKDEHVAVFTSGGAISVAVRAALKLADDMAIRVNWGIANASITRVQVRRSGYYLQELNNITHLHLAADSALITYR